MKFLDLLVWIIIFIIALLMLSFIGIAFKTALTVIVIVFIFWIIISIAKHYRNEKKFPGGAKGSKLQGIWVLEKHLHFDPALRKWEEVTVEPKKNYFEFNGSNFRSGDFDEKHKQLPAEYTPFSVEGENVIFKLESLSKANWRWAIKGRNLELTGEMLSPKDSKSQFTFYKKNWA
jgi:hypothetical protein